RLSTAAADRRLYQARLPVLCTVTAWTAPVISRHRQSEGTHGNGGKRITDTERIGPAIRGWARGTVGRRDALPGPAGQREHPGRAMGLFLRADCLCRRLLALH